MSAILTEPCTDKKKCAEANTTEKHMQFLHENVSSGYNKKKISSILVLNSSL